MNGKKAELKTIRGEKTEGALLRSKAMHMVKKLLAILEKRH